MEYDYKKSMLIDGMDEYQSRAVASAIYPLEYTIVYPTLGLTGEAGEVAEKIKKHLRDDTVLTPIDRDELCKELGDVLWYVAALARDLNLTMGQVAQVNLHKLADRKARGKIKGNGDNR